MKSVHKQIIFDNISEVRDYVYLNMYGFIKILKIGMQKDTVCVWYEVDLTKTNTFDIVEFRIVRTGDSIYDDEYDKLEYLNTLSFMDDSLIFHFYLVKKI